MWTFYKKKPLLCQSPLLCGVEDRNTLSCKVCVTSLQDVAGSGHVDRTFHVMRCKIKSSCQGSEQMHYLPPVVPETGGNLTTDCHSLCQFSHSSLIFHGTLDLFFCLLNLVFNLWLFFNIPKKKVYFFCFYNLFS